MRPHKTIGILLSKKTLFKLTILAIIIWFFPHPAWSACHVVTASGSGSKSGADWNNAYQQLPGTLVRGDTYYLADGSYSNYDFETPNSGTTTITVKKAIASDHCTDTGWNTSTMGSGQATFQTSGGAGCTNFRVGNVASVGYFILDGQVGTAENKGSYGIYMPLSFSASSCDNGPYNITTGSGGCCGNHTAQHITMQYVEIAGSCGGISENSSYRSSCDSVTNAPKSDCNFYMQNTSSSTFDHLFIHNSAGSWFCYILGNSSNSIQNSYFHLNNYTSSQHSNCMDLHGGNGGVTFFNDSFHDAEGSGCVTSLNAGGSGTDSNVVAYDNVFWYSQGNPTSRSGFGDGVFVCINGNSCPGWLFYDNDIEMPAGANTAAGFWNGSSGSMMIENNIWYNSQNVAWTGLTGGSTEDYNAFLNSGSVPMNGSHDLSIASAPDPYTNWPAGDFSKASENNDWSKRTSLSSPYNTDAADNTFTTDIGAFQFESGQQSGAPNPPTNLAVTVIQ